MEGKRGESKEDGVYGDGDGSYFSASRTILERCNPRLHVANRHMSISQLLLLIYGFKVGSAFLC